MNDVDTILELFGLSDKNIIAERIDSGHINRTYKITYGDDRYILQRLNSSLSGHSESIMSNIALVSECVENTIRFLDHNGKNYLCYDNAVWRIYEFVPNSVSYDTLEDERLIYGFGNILGRFHRDTGKIDPKALHITIEDFHNTKKHIKKLLSLESLPQSYRPRFERAAVFSDRLSEKGLSLKAAHNDVKCSNVLFDKDTGEALALIDLDTVMPGYYAYDVGDGIRSACVKDDTLDFGRLKAFCRGYFSAYKGEYTLTAEEIFLGLICITAELSSRYLYDALSGEGYFSDKTDGQKTERGEQLLRLSEFIAGNEKEIIKAIEERV